MNWVRINHPTFEHHTFIQINEMTVAGVQPDHDELGMCWSVHVLGRHYPRKFKEQDQAQRQAERTLARVLIDFLREPGTGLLCEVLAFDYVDNAFKPLLNAIRSYEQTFNEGDGI